MVSNGKIPGLLAALLLISSLASAQVVHVSPVPGDPVTSGANLLNGLASILDASAAKPYVLRIDPGLYELGSTPLVMKPYVDIEGSGQRSTIIRGLGNNDGTYTTGVVRGASSAELRDLQVQCIGRGYQTAIAVALVGVNTRLRDVTLVSISADGSWGLRGLEASPTLQDVTINVSGNSSSGSAAYGISNTGLNFSRPVIRRAVITVNGATNATGIYSDDFALPEIRDAEITVNGFNPSGIVYAYTDMSGITLEVTNSRINATASAGTAEGVHLQGNETLAVTHSNIVASSSSGSSYGLRNVTSGATSRFLVDHCDVTGTTSSVWAWGPLVRVGASKLDGPVLGSAATCASSFSGSYAPLNASCL